MLPQDLAACVKGCLVVVSDTTVWSMHGATLETALKSYAPELEMLVWTVEPGEASKTRATKASLEDFMLARGYDQSSVVLGIIVVHINDCTHLQVSS